MANYGYILHSTSDKTMAHIEAFRCCRIYNEDRCDESSRPLRRHMVSQIQPGDCIVTPKLTHIAKGCIQLSALLQMCHLKNVRLVAIEDEIDTGGELYPETSEKNLISAFRDFPYDFLDLKSEIQKKCHKSTDKDIQRKVLRMQRDEQAINMYLSGITLDDILRATNMGMSTLYRILRRNGINRNRWGGRKPICECPSFLS